ncbi:MAG: hypothetical protein ACTSU6_03175 [Candidatus Njordarchaeales archaeon]
MSLFDANLVEIKLYYTFKDRNGSKFLIVLSDEKAEELLQNEEKKGDVEALVTKWSTMNWRDQNISVEKAYSKTNALTGEKSFDHISYRDAIIKSCLKQWDIVVEGQTVPVTPEAIDSLPGDIVMSLYSKYERVLDYTADELKN